MIASAIYFLSLGLGVFAISASVAIVTYAMAGLLVSIIITLPVVLLDSCAVAWLDSLVETVEQRMNADKDRR